MLLALRAWNQAKGRPQYLEGGREQGGGDGLKTVPDKGDAPKDGTEPPADGVRPPARRAWRKMKVVEWRRIVVGITEHETIFAILNFLDCSKPSTFSLLLNCIAISWYLMSSNELYLTYFVNRKLQRSKLSACKVNYCNL